MLRMVLHGGAHRRRELISRWWRPGWPTSNQLRLGGALLCVPLALPPVRATCNPVQSVALYMPDGIAHHAVRKLVDLGCDPAGRSSSSWAGLGPLAWRSSPLMIASTLGKTNTVSGELPRPLLERMPPSCLSCCTLAGDARLCRRGRTSPSCAGSLAFCALPPRSNCKSWQLL